MDFETLNVRDEGAVLFAEIAAPPMNLLTPELVRDLVSLIQEAEADDAVQVLVFKSADPDYFISHVDVTRISEYRAEASKLTGEPSLAAPVPLPEREPPGHHRADRGSRTRRRQRVRAGDRHALRGARVGDLQSVRARVRCAPRWGRHPTPGAPHGPLANARGDVERGRLRRRAGRAVRLDQSSPARRRARRFRQLARTSDRRVSGRRSCRGQGPGQRDRARAGRGVPPRLRPLRRDVQRTRGARPARSRASERFPDPGRRTGPGLDAGRARSSTAQPTRPEGGHHEHHADGQQHRDGDVGGLDRPDAVRGHDVAGRRRRPRQGVLPAPRVAARHRLQAHPGHPRGTAHPARLARLDPVRGGPDGDDDGSRCTACC